MDIAVLHPGTMGAGLASVLVDAGHHVLWLPVGRSGDTVQRATTLGLEAVASVDDLVRRCRVIVSICPPHAAIDVADQVVAATPPFDGVYVDANAISPGTAATVATVVSARGARYVDGGVIGPPPPGDSTRMYLSGPDATGVATLFSEGGLDTVVLGPSPTAASALKMAYAAWTKTSAALLLAIRAAARSEGVDSELRAEWERSAPGLSAVCDRAALSAMTKGWRWIGEMEEIADTMASLGLPNGFAEAGAEIYRRVQTRAPAGDDSDLDRVVADLMAPGGRRRPKP